MIICWPENNNDNLNILKSCLDQIPDLINNYYKSDRFRLLTVLDYFGIYSNI